MTSPVSDAMIEAGVKELRANLDLSPGLLDELEDDSNLHISLRAAYLAMKAKEEAAPMDYCRLSFGMAYDDHSPVEAGQQMEKIMRGAAFKATEHQYDLDQSPADEVELPLAGYPVPETVSTREHALHCFACGGALSHSCCCPQVTLHRDALVSLIYWVQSDTLDATHAALSAIRNGDEGMGNG